MKSVYISSGFKDMSYERELLQKSVLPQLNDELGLYCDNAYFDDTRLGVHLDLDTEDGAKMLLPLCLDKLDYHKYMVVFLGERYGYIPSDRYLSAVFIGGVFKRNRA